MGILHRHLFASVAGTCVVAAAVFVFVLIAGVGLKSYLALMMAGQIEPTTALRLFALLLPYAAVYALPIGLLTAVLLVLGRMSSQQEITAMRAAGLSLGYISRPIWVIAGAAVLLSLVLNYYVTPRARSAGDALVVEAVKQNPLGLIVPRTFVRDFRGYVVYVGERDGSVLRDFWLWELDAQKRVSSLMRAKSCEIQFREEDNRLVLTLRDTSVETRDRDAPEDFSRPRPVGNSDSMTVELTLEGLLESTKSRVRAKWMTLDQLLARRDELQTKQPAPDAKDQAKEQAELVRVKVLLSERAAASFGVLALAFVAVPLGIKVSRKETSANLGIAVVLVLGYYFLAALTGMLERSPGLRPELWVWAPPLVYAAAGIWLFRRVDRA